MESIEVVDERGLFGRGELVFQARVQADGGPATDHHSLAAARSQRILETGGSVTRPEAAERRCSAELAARLAGLEDDKRLSWLCQPGQMTSTSARLMGRLRGLPRSSVMSHCTPPETCHPDLTCG